MLSMQSILDNFSGRPPIKGIVGGVGIHRIFYLTAYNIENKTEKTSNWLTSNTWVAFAMEGPGIKVHPKLI